MVLDKRDKNGRIVFVAKLGKNVHSIDFTVTDCNLFFFSLFAFLLGNVSPNTQFVEASMLDDMWMQVLLSDPLTQMNGLSVIADCTSLSSTVLKWLIPRNCKVGAAKLESLPVKQWTIHVVNMGPIMKACVMLIKPFLRKATIEKVNQTLVISLISILLN